MSSEQAARKAAKAVAAFKDHLAKKEKVRMPAANAAKDQLFSLSYDLHEGDDYSAVIERLTQLKAAHWLESTWVFRSSETVDTLDSIFAKLFAEDQGYLLSPIGQEVRGRQAVEYRALPAAD